MLIEPGLRERCFGAFEGLLYSEIGQRYSEAYAVWQVYNVDIRFPSGSNAAEALRDFHIVNASITRFI